MEAKLAQVSEAMKRSDFESLRQLALDFLTTVTRPLGHPFNGVITQCKSSLIEGMDNILFFSDDKGDNRWLLVQRENVIDAVVSESRIKYLVNENTKSDIQKRLNDGSLDHHFSNQKIFGGYVLSSTRPYHYFYDQLINLDVLSGEGVKVSHAPDCFLLAKHLSPIYGDLIADPGKFYLYPTIMGGMWRAVSQNVSFYSACRRMERQIAQSIAPDRKRASFTLWFAVVGQKRSWLEQVHGAVSLIDTLAKRYSQVHVIVDGLTASEGARSRFPEEEYLADEIRARVAGNTTVRSVIGEDYPTKIALCQNADLAITDTGTGSMVPVRFCGIPTVMHGPAKIDAFANDPETRANVRWVREVIDAPHPDFPRDDFTSYHLHWQRIFNMLREVLPELKDKFDPIAVPSGPAWQDDFETMTRMHEMIREGICVADVLLFLSSFFQKDRHVSQALAREAVIHRQGTNRDAISFLNKLRQ